MFEWETFFLTFLYSQHSRIGNQSIVPELPDLILHRIFEILHPRCHCCTMREVPFHWTYKPIPSIGPTPWHYLVTRQGWKNQNFNRYYERTGCTMVPGNFSQDEYPQLEEFSNGMPICKFFELWGVRWPQIYTWMLAAQGYSSVEFNDDFLEMVKALKNLQAFTQAWQPP